MKIIYIANARIPTEKAHGIQIMKMCEAFADNGASVELAVPRRLNKIRKDSFDYYAVRRNFIIRQLPCLDLMFLPVLKTLWFWIESWSFAIFAAAYFLLHNDAVYYTRDALIAAIFSVLGKKIFYEIHDWPERPDGFHGLAWRKSAGLIVISDGLRNELLKHGIADKKIILARDAVDIREFNIKESQGECRQKLDLSQDKKIILYSGHLYAWKGADVLLEAARILTPEERTDVFFVFVGGTTEDVARFRVIAADLPHVLIVGYRPHQEIPLWLKAADILVMPNSAKEKISRLYTSPMKLFEYMASGKPIVASDLPSLREVLNEYNARMAEPDNAESIVKVITGLLNDPIKAAELSRNARIQVGEYTWDKRAEKILNFIAL